MLAAFYQIGAQTEDLFSDLKIASNPTFSTHFNKYNVVFINIINEVQEAKYNVNEMINSLEEYISKEIIELYPCLAEYSELSLYQLLDMAYAETNIGFIFIIDEWDSILRDPQFNSKDHMDFLNFLRVLFKDRAYLHLAYMTGILPIKKLQGESLLNMFDEFSMVEPGELSEFVGFTEAEVKKVCETHAMDFEQMTDWYKGYYLEGEHVFCPYSVYKAVQFKSFESYWTKTASYEALRDYTSMNFDGLKDIIISLYNGNKVKVKTEYFGNDISTLNSADDVLTLLVHLGYLGYIKESNEVFIPNKEVKRLYDIVFETPVWSEYIKSYRISKELLMSTLQLDNVKVAKSIEKMHGNAPLRKYNTEDSLSYTVLESYKSAKDYWDFKELESGRGFIDILFVPKPTNNNFPAIVIELKWDKSAKSAIKQIEDRDYPTKVKMLAKGKILLVVINYNSRTKKHSCIIKEHEYMPE
jgi:hypothetical protein